MSGTSGPLQTVPPEPPLHAIEASQALIYDLGQPLLLQKRRVEEVSASLTDATCTRSIGHWFIPTAGTLPHELERSCTDTPGARADFLPSKEIQALRQPNHVTEILRVQQ